MSSPVSNRLTGVLIFALFCYLGLFAWNARTGYLDTVAERSGLEVVSYILSPVMVVKDTVAHWWDRYVALIGVSDENTRLRDELRKTEQFVILSAEEKAELLRLRALLGIEALREVPGVGARVIAMRFGPQAVLKTLTVNKGFVDGAVIGTPVMAAHGAVGRVHRTAPHAATVLLITDPGSRLPVISQDSRTPGILKGTIGEGSPLELTYVAQHAQIAVGELLITSGMDGAFPKGIPVGVVTAVEPGHEILFQKVHADPVVALDYLEEVILLLPEGSAPVLLPPLPGTGDISDSALLSEAPSRQRLELSPQSQGAAVSETSRRSSGERNSRTISSGSASQAGSESTIRQQRAQRLPAGASVEGRGGTASPAQR